jgi:acyl-coenzyme A thioesterase PaaI-like protein
MALSAEQLTELIRSGLPQAAENGFLVDRIDEQGQVWCRQPFRANLTRPGGTLSGPAIMALADGAMYAAVLHRLGRFEMAVTQNLHINFLHRPPLQDLLACAAVLHCGRRSFALDVRLYSDADGRDLVAHATGSYVLIEGGSGT